MEMLSKGLFGSITSEHKAVATRFLLYGFMLFITYLLMSVIEKYDELEIPGSIGIALFLLKTIGVILMPASGFWLIYPVTIAIVLKNRIALQKIKYNKKLKWNFLVYPIPLCFIFSKL